MRCSWACFIKTEMISIISSAFFHGLCDKSINGLCDKSIKRFQSQLRPNRTQNTATTALFADEFEKKPYDDNGGFNRLRAEFAKWGIVSCRP